MELLSPELLEQGLSSLFVIMHSAIEVLENGPHSCRIFLVGNVGLRGRSARLVNEKGCFLRFALIDTVGEAIVGERVLRVRTREPEPEGLRRHPEDQWSIPRGLLRPTRT